MKMMSNETYEVEKVVGRRTVKLLQSTQVQYRIKWSEYSSGHNSWEPIENLDCQESIDAFQKGNGGRILSAKRTNTGIDYLIQLKSNDIEIVSSSRARDLWPELVIDFLEKSLEWSGIVNLEEPVTQSDSLPDGDPISVTYATRRGNDTLYWINWNDGAMFIKAKEAKKKYADVVLNYLEEHLVAPSCMES